MAKGGGLYGSSLILSKRVTKWKRQSRSEIIASDSVTI